MSDVTQCCKVAMERALLANANAIAGADQGAIISQPHARETRAEVHSFPREIARKYSIAAAIILQLLAHKVERSGNVRDGRPWFYDSLRKIKKRYPYLSVSAINRAVKRLEKAGLVRVDNHNRRKFDRTRWYTVPAMVIRRLKKEVEKRIRFFACDAQRHGVNGAIVLFNLQHWIKKARRKDPPEEWHPMSPAGLARDLPISASAIKRALAVLEKRKIIQSKPRYLGNIRGYQLYPEYWQTNRDYPGSETTGSERQMGAGSKWKMGGPERNETGSEWNGGGSKWNDDTHSKPFETKLKIPLKTSGSNEGFFTSPDGKGSGAEKSDTFNSSLDEPEFIELQKSNAAERGKLASAALSNISSFLRELCRREMFLWDAALIGRLKKAASEKRLTREISNSLSMRFPDKPREDDLGDMLIREAVETMALAVKAIFERQPKLSDAWMLRLQVESEINLLGDSLSREAKKRELEDFNAKLEAEEKSSPFPYPDPDNQADDPDLPVKDKVRLLRAIVRWQINTQYERPVPDPMKKWGKDDPRAKRYGLMWGAKSNEKAAKFFTLNPKIAVSKIIGALDYCHQAYWMPDDPLFFYSRGGVNLDFLFKHLERVIAENELQPDFPGVKYLDDDI